MYCILFLFKTWSAETSIFISDNKNRRLSSSSFKQKKYTIHPELLDKSGNITEEELLTVRFSNDNDSTLEEKGSTTD